MYGIVPSMGSCSWTNSPRISIESRWRSMTKLWNLNAFPVASTLIADEEAEPRDVGAPQIIAGRHSVYVLSESRDTLVVVIVA